MQRVCSKCNTLVTTDGAFCPSCGEPLPAAVDMSKQPNASQSVQYSVPNQDAHQGTMPNYGNATAGTATSTQYASHVVNNQEMSLGQWVGTVICSTWFGIISLILNIVWAVSENTPIAKKRYCQAMIIIQSIGIVLSIIAYIVMFAVFANIIPQFIDEVENAANHAAYSSSYWA